MAKMTDVHNIRHRKHVVTIPEDILSRLSPAELNLRCAHAAELHERAGKSQAEHARYLTGRARQALKAPPVVEFIEQLRKMHQRALEASPTQGFESGELGWFVSERSAAYQAIKEFDEEYQYPSGLKAAVDNALLGKWVPDSPLGQIAAEIVAHHLGTEHSSVTGSGTERSSVPHKGQAAA